MEGGRSYNWIIAFITGGLCVCVCVCVYVGGGGWIGCL